MVMQCSVEDFGAGQSKLSTPQDSLESLFAPAVPEPADAEASLAAISAEPEEPWKDAASGQAKRRRDEEEDDLDDDEEDDLDDDEDEDDDDDEEDDFEDDDVGGAYDDDDLDDEDEDIFYDEDEDD